MAEQTEWCPQHGYPAPCEKCGWTHSKQTCPSTSSEQKHLLSEEQIKIAIDAGVHTFYWPDDNDPDKYKVNIETRIARATAAAEHQAMKDAGWVKLAKDQTLPNPIDFLASRSAIFEAGFRTGQSNLISAGFRRIEQE